MLYEPRWLNYTYLLGVRKMNRFTMATYLHPWLSPKRPKGQDWRHNPCLLGVPKLGWGKNGFLTVALWGSQEFRGIKMAEWRLSSKGLRNGEQINMSKKTLAFLWSRQW